MCYKDLFKQDFVVMVYVYEISISLDGFGNGSWVLSSSFEYVLKSWPTLKVFVKFSTKIVLLFKISLKEVRHGKLFVNEKSFYFEKRLIKLNFILSFQQFYSLKHL